MAQLKSGTRIYGTATIDTTIILNGTSVAVSTNSGALTVAGGAGIGRSLYVGGITNIVDTTNATSTNSGALQVVGGVGINKSLYVGGTTASFVGNVNIGDVDPAYSLAGSKGLVVYNANESEIVLQNASSGKGGGSGLRLYYGYGNPRLLLKEDRNLSFGTNNEYWLTFTTSTLSTVIEKTTVSTSTQTGALVVNGGVGIGQNLYVGGTLAVGTGSGGTITGLQGLTSTNIVVSGTTSATSTTTGALQVAGGVGIGGSLFVGNNATFSGNLIPSADTTYDLGTSSTQWRSLYVSTNTVYIGGVAVSVSGGSLTVGGSSVGGGGISSPYSGIFTITNTTSATSTITGALQVAGGVGIQGDLFVNRVINSGQTVLTNRFLSSPYRLVAPINSIYQGTGVVSTLTTGIATSPPRAIAVDPFSRFVYVTNWSSGTVSQYSINQTTGALSTITTATSAGGFNSGVAVEPTGRFAYVTSDYGQVRSYSIDQTTGALTLIGTVAAGNTPQEITVDPTGRFVYVGNTNDNTVSGYSINQSTGALTTISTVVATGSSPIGVEVDPTGRFLYVNNWGSASISQYSINQTTGALSTITTAVAGASTGRNVKVDPSGRFAYASGNNTIYRYLINQSTGALTSNGSLSLSSVSEIVFDPTGRFLYVMGGTTSPKLYTYSINQATGSLTQTSSIATTNNGEIAIDPTGRFIYITDATNNVVNQFVINNFSAGQSVISASVNSTSTTTGALVVNGGVGIGGSLFVGGLVTLYETTEVLDTKTGATGTVTHDFSTGAVWYHSSISANFTVDFTNVPTTDNRVISMTLILAQGATAYIPSAVQISGSAQTIKWEGGVQPSGNANKTDIVNFTLVRTGSAWSVLGSLGTYG